MKPTEFAKDIERSAQKLGVGRRELFDAIISISCSFIALKAHDLKHLYEEVAYEPHMVERPQLRYQPDISPSAYLAELVVLKLKLIEVMKAGFPFEDRLTAVYSEFLSGTAGQFMSPAYVGRLLQQLVEGEPREGRPWTVTEPTCGTGALSLGYLADVHEREGKLGIARIHLSINDIDLRLAKVALFQIAFHSIQHKAPLGLLYVERKNLMTEYHEQKPIFVCRKAEGFGREIEVLKRFQDLMVEGVP